MILWSSLTIHGSLATTQPEPVAALASPPTTSRPPRPTSGAARPKAAPAELVINGVPVTQHGDRPRGSVRAALRRAERLLEAKAPAIHRAVKAAKAGTVGARGRDPEPKTALLLQNAGLTATKALPLIGSRPCIGREACDGTGVELGQNART